MVTKEDVEKALAVYSAVALDADAADDAAAKTAAAAKAAKAASAKAYDKADYIGDVCDAAWDKYTKLKKEYENGN